MKEYLTKMKDGGYKLIPSKMSDDDIEVPDGAEIYLDLSLNLHAFYKDNFKQTWCDNQWEDTVHNSLNLKLWNDMPVLWQRHTQPEELPFVDDEMNKEWERVKSVQDNESINDQYAEIEKVRHESQAWANRPVGRCRTIPIDEGGLPDFSFEDTEQVRKEYKLKNDMSVDDYRNSLRCADAKPNQTTINAMNEADTLFSDAVNHPSHYASGEIECIDAIESSMTHEAFCGYLKGNVQKYMWRYENKGGLESLEKAQWYLNKLISHIG